MEHHQAESEIGEAPTLNSKAHILSPKPLLTQPDLDSAKAQDGQSVFIVALLTMLMICQFVSAKGSTREPHRHAQHVCNTHTVTHKCTYANTCTDTLHIIHIHIHLQIHTHAHVIHLLTYYISPRGSSPYMPKPKSEKTNSNNKSTNSYVGRQPQNLNSSGRPKCGLLQPCMCYSADNYIIMCHGYPYFIRTI